MKWFIVYIMTSFGEPTEVVITRTGYDSFNQCQQHEFYQQDKNGADFGTVNAMCVQENTFSDFTQGDFEDALVTDFRQLEKLRVECSLL